MTDVKLWKNSQGTLYCRIPKSIRKQIDLDPGDRVDVQFNDEKNIIEIRKIKMEVEQK